MKAHHKSFTILLADSDPDEYCLLRDALEENGYQGNLVCAFDAIELMSRLRNGQVNPSLILLEPNRFSGNGGDVLAELRDDPHLRHIPVVVLTTSSEPEDVAQSYAMGARSHLVKPLTFDDQVRMVESLLSYWMDAVVLPDRPAPGSTSYESFESGPVDALERSAIV